MPDKICFVIAPIGEEGSDIRKRSDRVFAFVIEPAVQECGYKAVRADKISKPGIITNQVIQEVIGAPMVVADLTGRNANAFYELAIRHMVKQPLVQMITKGETIPFDIAATRVLYYDEPELETVERTRAELVEHIRSAEQGADKADNPISISVDLQALRVSADPARAQLGELADVVTGALAGIRAEISELRKEIDMTALERLSRSTGTLSVLLGAPGASGAGGFAVSEGLGIAEIAKRAYNVRSHDAPGAQGSHGAQPPSRGEGPNRTEGKH
jgi:hypothetical protein